MHAWMHACAWAAPGHAQPEGSAKARASCPANAGASKPRPPRLPVISQSPGHQTLIITLPEKHNKTHHQRKDKHAMQRTNPQEATTTITTCARTPENKQKRVPQEIAPPRKDILRNRGIDSPAPFKGCPWHIPTTRRPPRQQGPRCLPSALPNNALQAFGCGQVASVKAYRR